MVAFPGHTRIENIEAAQMRNDKQLEALRNKIVQVDDRIDRTLNAVIATHDKYLEFTARFDKVDERFKAADIRFNQMDQRFNQVDMRLNALEHRMDRRFDQVDERLERMDHRFGSLETRMDRMEGVMVAVAEKLGVRIPA